MDNAQRKHSTRQKLLASIFTEGNKRGVTSEMIREEIAPAVLKKRLSQASNAELFRCLEHITCYRKKRSPYASSLAGLREEIVDLARQRFGEEYESPLNALCRRFGVGHHRWLDLRHGRAVKKTLLRLEKENPRE